VFLIFLNWQFRKCILGLRSESTPNAEWTIEEMSSIVLEEARDLYELCERTLADTIQSPDDLHAGTKPEKRLFGLVLASWTLGTILVRFIKFT
jgi:hypothetical protein